MLDTIRSNQWRIGKAAVLTLLISISSSTGQAQGIKFSEVARQLGVPGNVENGVSAYGHGVIIADLNNDLLPDIYISNAVRYADHLPETLYLSSPNGYVECDKARGVDDPYGWTGSHGICFVDYDNDGDYDIFNATTDDRNRLYQNDGNAFFKNVTDLAGLPLIRIVFPDFDSAPYGYGTRGVVAFDADNDGDMDLFAVNWGPAESRYDMTKIIKVPEQPNEFYLNNGNGTFKSVTNSGLTHPPNRSWMGTQGVAAGDIDNDGDIDVLIIHRNYTGIAEDGRKIEGFDSGRQVPNQLMINDGTGKFTDETAARGLFDPLNDANGATLADYDNDGDLDIFIPPKAKTRGKIRVYRNRGNGFFDDVTDQLNLTQWGFSTFLFDADNDGDLDLIAPRTRDTTLFYRNRGNGTFELLSNTGVELYNYDPRGGAVADIDNDGDLDLYLADANKELQTNAGNRLFRNELNSTNRWLKVTGRGPKGDLGGFGTKIWVFDRGHMEEMTRLVGYREVQNAYGYLCQDDPVQHFGLGQRDSADVKVRLLDGTVLKMYSVPANTRLYFSRPRQLVKTGGDGQTEVAFSPLPQPLKVQVRDAYGRTIYGARVIFTSDDPSGRFTTEQVYSDIAGNAQIGYVLGVNRTQTITAWCEADPSARVVFTASAIEVSSVASLVKSGGDAQQGQGGYPLPQKLRVRALNSAGIGIPGVAVIFEPAAGCGSIAGLPRAERLTSADGYAEAEWTLGNRPSTQQQCAVYVKDQPTLRQIFQAGSFGPPEKLVLLGSQRPAGRVDQPLNDSVVVQITDSVDRPLRNILVQFAVAAGGGLVNRQSSVQVATRANGCAEVQWKLGTQAGRASQVLQVTSPAIPNRVLTVTADALPGPAARLEYVSGDGQVGILTQPLPEPLAVRVSDTFGNAIESHPVAFSVTQGDALFAGQSQLNVTTNADGVAQAVLRLGRKPDVTVRAVARNEEGNLEGSPVVFKLRGTAGAPSPDHSVFETPSSHIADGQTQGRLQILLRDAFDNPVSGYQVQVQALGVPVQLVQPSSTDSTGAAWAHFTASQIGQVIFQLFVDNKPFLTRTVLCIAGPPAQMVGFGDGQMQYAGEFLPQPIAVLITDAWQHPIADYPVFFRIVDGGGAIPEPQPVRTNDLGLAEVHWQLGPILGTQKSQAVAENLPFVQFTATALPFGAVRLVMVSGDRQTTAPNEAAPDSLVVQVLDSLRHPMPEVRIDFGIVGGESAENGRVTPASVQTRADGTAAAAYFAGSEIGLRIIRAGSAWGSVQFKVLVQRQALLSFEKLSPDSLTLPPHAEMEIIVRVRDGFGAPAAGAALSCTISGGGELIDPPPYFTAPTGIFATKWRLGAAGMQTCEIRGSSAVGVARFTAFVANHEPQFTAPDPMPDSINVLVGEETKIFFSAQDIDGDEVTLQYLNPNFGNFQQFGKRAIFTLSPDSTLIGNHLLELAAIDTYGAADTLQLLLQVSAEPLYFLLLQRLPKAQIEAFYDQPVNLLVEPADSSVLIVWMKEEIPVGVGPSLTTVFTEEEHPDGEAHVAAYLQRGRKLQILSWQIRLHKNSSLVNTPAEKLPRRTELSAGYPNPFNPSTRVRFTLAVSSWVRIEVTDLRGRCIKTLIDGRLSMGEHQVEWDGRDEHGVPVGSGVYLCRMQTDDYCGVQKLTLIR